MVSRISRLLRLSSTTVYSCIPAKQGPGAESKKGIVSRVGVGSWVGVSVGSKVGVVDTRGAAQLDKNCVQRMKQIEAKRFI